MNFWDWMKSKAAVLLLHAGGLLLLCVFLFLLNNTRGAICLIAAVWILALLVYFLVEYYFRKRYFQELEMTLDELEPKYLIAELAKPAAGLEDKLYWEILRSSNKSVIEELHKLEDRQKEYKEYLEAWVHEVKTPITAANLICKNHEEEHTKRILLELDEIENEVEKVLYYVRMENVYQDYLIHPVSLRELVLSVLRAEKRHFLACRAQVELDMDETVVSTDEKWAAFILKQIFSNARKYRKETGLLLKIYVKHGEQQKSLILEDNGCGIREEDVGRIFEKGFTGKNGRTEDSRATGMGLYLCKRLCEKLGIGISCEAEEHCYTRMILTFPDSDYHQRALTENLQK